MGSLLIIAIVIVEYFVLHKEYQKRMKINGDQEYKSGYDRGWSDGYDKGHEDGKNGINHKYDYI